MNKLITSSSRPLRVIALGLCLTTLPLLISATAGCQHRNVHDQTAGQRVEDLRTTSRVKSALSADPIHKFDGVNVETFNGTVQLSGFVTTRDQAERAAEIARGTIGARNVVNNVTLRD